MKIGIFTSRPVDPIHPRLAAFIEYFNQKNIPFDLIPAQKHSLFSRINWLSLFFFDNWSVFVNRKRPADYDIILINDLKYLPLARLGKRYQRKVIYETIDHNVSLRTYSLGKKIPLTKYFSKNIMNRFSSREKKLAGKYCDLVIVNSKALKENFPGNTEILYYYSVFEDIKAKNDSKKLPALLYLGEFSEEKGAEEVLELRSKMNLELFIYGTVSSEIIREKIQNPAIRHTLKLGQLELMKRIEDHLKTNYLIGLSFIKPVHYSYETQEANKDIDYLALGIPLIGNHRKPTAEKIAAGCGIFSEDDKSLDRIVKDEKFRQTLSENCRLYYEANYSKDKFMAKLDQIFSKFLN